MSSQIVERELVGMIGQLQQQGRHSEAALIDMALFHAKGHLPDLVRIRDEWASVLERDTSTRLTH